MAGDGGDGLGNDGIECLVGTVNADHPAAFGGENGARKAMEISTGVVNPGTLREEGIPRLEKWCFTFARPVVRY